MAVSRIVGGAQVVIGDLQCTVDLLAGQTTDVGSVQASYDDEDEMLTVTYDTSEINPGGDPGDWYIAETHLDVEDDFDDFPTAGRNNPKVGRFDVAETYGPGVDTAVFDVPAAEPADGELVVAAHAVVYQVDCAGATLSDLTGSDTTITAAFDGPIYAGGDLTVTNPSEEVTISVLRDGMAYELGTVAAGATETFSSLADLVDIDLDDGDDDVAWFDEVSLVGVANEEDLTVESLMASCLVTVEETAWADGCAFNPGRGGNWATYFEFDTEEGECGCLEDE